MMNIKMALLMTLIGFHVSRAAHSDSTPPLNRPIEMTRALAQLQKQTTDSLRATQWTHLVKTLAAIEAELTAHPPNPKQRDELWVLQAQEWIKKIERKGFSADGCRHSLKRFHTWVDPQSKDLKDAPDSAHFVYAALQARCKTAATVRPAPANGSKTVESSVKSGATSKP